MEDGIFPGDWSGFCGFGGDLVGLWVWEGRLGMVLGVLDCSWIAPGRRPGLNICGKIAPGRRPGLSICGKGAALVIGV